jgi:hypothetical protein
VNTQTRPIQALRAIALGTVLLGTLLTGGPVGCSGNGSSMTGDPLTDIRNPEISVKARIESAQRARLAAESGAADGVETRRVLKDVAWTRRAPTELRLAVLEAIFDDEAMEADSRSLAAYMLPLEQDEAVVAYIADVATQRDWTDLTPSLVRCLARRTSTLPDEQRPETTALRTLHAQRPLANIVLDVFLSPGVEGETYGVDWAQLTRADAWDLLARLDSSGRLRAGLLVSDAYESLTGESAKLRDDLRACYKDLRTIPLNAAELTWLSRLRDPRRAANEAWWTQATSAVAMVPQENRPGLSLRHIEPIRWAAAHKPQLLTASRDELFSQLQLRLTGRKMHRRSERSRESDPLLQERLKRGEGTGRVTFSWADLLTILVIDDALATDSVRTSLFRQAELDMDDKTTEYGGTLGTADTGESPGDMTARLFAPRPASRIGDERFVASADMLRSSDRALAHYHFHAQRWGNARYAGPSPDDRVYAWRQGRACLVITAIRSGVLAIDYYQPNGLILDLGEITQP